MHKLLLFLLLNCTALAQTTVTATVINLYANGTVSAQTVVTTGNASTSNRPATLSAAGFFSMTLNAGTYIFTVCAAPSNSGLIVAPKQACFSSAPITISGNSQDISKTLNAAATTLTPPVTVTPGNATKFQGMNVDSGVRSASAGSMMVVDPTGSKYISQTKPCVDWRDHGITTSGDQSSNITSTWNAVSASGCGVMLPLGTLNVAKSIAPRSVEGGQGAGYSVEGVAGAGGSGASTTLRWTGGAGTVLNLDRQRDSIIGRFNIDMNNAATVGILVSQLASTTGNISSHNLYHDINIGRIPAKGYGLQLVPPSGDSTQNDEAHTLWRMSYASDNAYASGSYGYYSNGGANMRSIGQYEAEAYQTGTGFLYNADSFHHIGGLTQSHNTAYNLAWGPGTIAFTHDEGSKQWMSFSNTQYSVSLLLNNFAEMNSPDLTKWQWDRTRLTAPLVSIANNFGNNTNITKLISPGRTGVGQTWISIADNLPALSPAYLPDLSMDGWDFAVYGAAARYKAMLALTAYGNGSYDTIFMLPGTEVGANGYSAGNQWLTSYSLSALYTDGSAKPHLVPFRFKASVADSSGTSAATYQLAAPTDPVTGTTYSGPLNVDFKTNGNNFAMNHAQMNDATIIYEAGANTNQTKIYTNTQALSSGSATHTFANRFSFTSSSTFGCLCTDQTAANACKAVPASATTVKVAGTGSDTLWLQCTGH